MEQDKHIKQILLNSAEGASTNFTDAVLKRIYELPAVGTNYQPLVPSRWQQLFGYTFAFIGIMIVILCLLAVYIQIDPLKWIQSLQVPEIDYSKVLLFILCFWIVFAANALVRKKVLRTKGI